MRKPVFVRLAGELDAATAPEWRQQLAHVAGNDLTIDLRDCDFVDSTFLDALFRLATQGRSITVVECAPQIARIMAIAGLDAAVTIRPAALSDAQILPFRPAATA